MKQPTLEEEAAAAALAGEIARRRHLRLGVTALPHLNGPEVRFRIARSAAGRMVLTGPSGRHYWADTGEPCESLPAQAP